jgi:Ca-activated chloride channel homolog
MDIMKIVTALVLFPFSLNAFFGSVLELHRGVKAYQNKDFQQAQTYFENIAMQRPDDIQALYNAGKSAYAKQEYPAAEAFFNEARTQSKSTDDQTLRLQLEYDYANALARQKKYKESLLSYKQVIHLDPNHEYAKKMIDQIQKLLEDQSKEQEQKNNEQQQDKDNQDQKNNSDKNNQNQDQAGNQKQNKKSDQKQGNELKKQNDNGADQDDPGATENKDGQQKQSEQQGEKKDSDQQKQSNKEAKDAEGKENQDKNSSSSDAKQNEPSDNKTDSGDSSKNKGKQEASKAGQDQKQDTKESDFDRERGDESKNRSDRKKKQEQQDDKIHDQQPRKGALSDKKQDIPKDDKEQAGLQQTNLDPRAVRILEAAEDQEGKMLKQLLKAQVKEEADDESKAYTKRRNW